jgi:hypothetical protein
VELEELRQRLLLRSKPADIAALAQPAQISEVALSQAASKLKWETSLSPVEIAARLGISAAKAEFANGKSSTGNGIRVENAAVSNPPAPVAPEQISEPAEAFRDHFEHLNQLTGPIDAATQSTEEALRRMTRLTEHLSSLATNFQSVKAFAEQVRTLSASFEPMKGLDAQLDQVMRALYGNVKEVGAAIAPVKEFQNKLRRLMGALDSIVKFEEKVSSLEEAFRPASETPATAAQAA